MAKCFIEFNFVMKRNIFLIPLRINECSFGSLPNVLVGKLKFDGW